MITGTEHTENCPPPKMGNANKYLDAPIYTVRDTDDAVIPEILTQSLMDYLLDFSGVKSFHKSY